MKTPQKLGTPATPNKEMGEYTRQNKGANTNSGNCTADMTFLTPPPGATQLKSNWTLVTLRHVPTGSMYREIRKLLKNNEVSALYLLVGVNDTTWRDRVTRRTAPIYFSGDELCAEITEKFEYLMDFALNVCQIPKVIVIPVVGIDLATYNGDPIPNPWQQALDDGIKRLNSNIITLNAAHKNSTPLIHMSIYKSKGHGKTKTFYCRLWDGLHPRGDTLERWAGGILHAMQLNGDWI